jgi:XTP/dITP diphosphohydrolase
MREEKNNNEFPLKGKIVFFATGNIHKFDEARNILTKLDIAVGMLRIKGAEIQSDSLEEIARAGVRDAFNRCGLPVVVEDAGLFTEALNSFPGPYAAYAYKTLGNKGLLKLMNNIGNRKAVFRAAVAYFDSETDVPLVFKGEAEGEIITTEQSRSGRSVFGFDPIFRPIGSERTFAQMTIEEKNSYSHRAKAFQKFSEWYKRLQQSFKP